MNYDKAQLELDLLANIIDRHPEGIGGDELWHESGLGLHRRSFQRRMSALAESGRIRVEGKTRGVRYFSAVQKNQELPNSSTAKVTSQDADAYVPMSPEGEAIKAYVRQPRHLRKPVVYHTEFLEQYHPNHSAYLPAKLREQLHALGRSPAEQTPAGTFARDILNRLLIDLSWASSQLEGNT